MKEFEVKEILKGQKDSLEQLGTKEKFWFIENNIKKLFKVGLPNSGDNWVEVVVSEICNLLDIPHAKYEFATYANKKGTITTNIVPDEGRLVHGNELLARVFKKFNLEYEQDTFYKVKKHRIQTIALLMQETSIIKPPFDLKKSKSFSSAFEMFIGYVILDCLISNQDRHHENWAIIVYGEEVFLSPTYDHASGLGSKESEKRKEERLNTKDKNFMVKAFVKKAKTAFYDKGKIVKTIDSVRICGKINKEATLFWLNNIEMLNIDDIINIFKRIPKDLISQISIEFAIKMLEENKKRLLEIKEELKNE